MNISLKIGPNIIDSVFDVCNQKDSEEGLKLAEIKENDCMNFLENSFGMLHKDIDKHFEAVDKNGDGLVSKEEGVDRLVDNSLADSFDDTVAAANNDADDVELLLYTSGSNSKSFKFNDDLNLDDMSEEFLNQGFDKDRATKIVAHGWNEDATDFYSWYISAYDSSGWDINLICINWESHAKNLIYVAAAADAIEIGEKIGAEIVSNLLLNSTRLNQSPDLIHAIGHSLGAHLVGHIGKNSVDKIGRITGLDPARQDFVDDLSRRLSKADAELVDVIHTNGGDETGYFSFIEPMGHVDFYPNGGEHMPGCDKTNLVLLGGITFDSCSHNRATHYYTESIEHRCDNTFFLSKNCDSFSDYEDNDCQGRDELPMGEALTESMINTEGKYFLETGADSPYNLDGLEGRCPLSDYYVRKCQYNCQETRSFQKQSCASCTTSTCPAKYAEFISTGMLVCEEMQETVVLEEITPLDLSRFVITTEIPAEMYGMAFRQCDYAKCKRVVFADPDVYSVCPTYPFNDIDNCNSAGDALVDKDKMFIEFELVY